MHDLTLIKKSRNLRKRGFTLGEIVKETGLPKTTIYDHIFDIPVSFALKQKLERIKEQHTKRIVDYAKKKKRKLPRVPQYWNPELVLLVAHFLFDGEIAQSGCSYNNRNKILIDRVEKLTNKLFGLTAIHRFYPETGVHRISYFYTELGEFVKNKSQGLKTYIEKASTKEKIAFLRAFFDDEGSAYFHKKIRRVRGFQKDIEILKLIQKLLKDFEIETRIDEKYKEIIIPKKENLVKFRDKINFSKEIYINPNRKNSIWKQKLEKRKILEKMINSYQEF